MLLTKTIKVKINRSNLDHYTNLGFKCAIDEEIEIPISLLPKHSHKKIKIECDCCHNVYYIEYKNLLKSKYDVFKHYICTHCASKRRQEAIMKKYNVKFGFFKRNKKEE